MKEFSAGLDSGRSDVLRRGLWPHSSRAKAACLPSGVYSVHKGMGNGPMRLGSGAFQGIKILPSKSNHRWGNGGHHLQKLTNRKRDENHSLALAHLPRIAEYHISQAIHSRSPGMCVNLATIPSIEGTSLTRR